MLVIFSNIWCVNFFILKLKNRGKETTINLVEKIDNLVTVKNILVSVSDKSGLDKFVPQLIKINPDLSILSTGGTFDYLRGILGTTASDRHLVQVSDYTGQPETQGGLVKTLDFKIYLGLLTETYNPSHQADLQRTNASAIDMVIVNFYPFSETITKPDVTPEMARGNIDIGGPCMLRASAKNYHRVSSIVDPMDYPQIIKELESTGGKTTLKTRFELMKKVFFHTSKYDSAIYDYLYRMSYKKIIDAYPVIV